MLDQAGDAPYQGPDDLPVVIFRLVVRSLFQLLALLGQALNATLQPWLGPPVARLAGREFQKLGPLAQALGEEDQERAQVLRVPGAEHVGIDNAEPTVVAREGRKGVLNANGVEHSSPFR